MEGTAIVQETTIIIHVFAGITVVPLIRSEWAAT